MNARVIMGGMSAVFSVALCLSCLSQTLTSAPSREPVTTPASTTLAASSACATRATSCMASLTAEVRAQRGGIHGTLTQLKCF